MGPVYEMVSMQRRFKLVFASAQPDQSHSFPHEETLGLRLPLERSSKTSQTAWMCRLICVFYERTFQLLPIAGHQLIYCKFENFREGFRENKTFAKCRNHSVVY